MMLSVTPFCKILKTYMYKSAKKKSRKYILRYQYSFWEMGFLVISGVFVGWIVLLLMITFPLKYLTRL